MIKLYPLEEKQQKLVDRYLLSVSAYVVSVASAWTAKATGLTSMSLQTLAAGTFVIFLYVVGIYFLYRTGLNGRIKDSTFTQVQMFFAIGWVSYFITTTQELRGIFLTIYLFIAMFSFFTLNRTQTARIMAAIAATYGTIIVLDWYIGTAGFDLTVNIIQWCVLAAVLVWLRAIAGYVNAKREQIKLSSEKIRTQNREIQETNRRLEQALTRLNHLAITDELTGLSNRRHFMSTVKSHIDRCENDQLSFGLCVLDLDHFKAINDRWGHQIGDQVLVALARVLRDNLREYDFLARFGGEEFVLIVTRGDENVTRQCAERLRRAAESADLRGLGDNLQMTVTVGATVFQSGDTLETALERADSAMYRGKRMGRNVCYFEPDSMSRLAANVGSGGSE